MIDHKTLSNMSPLSFGSLIKTFFMAFIVFIISAWIGWLGIVLILLKIIGIIHWQWWIVALPLEYGVAYCFYMTIDGALYRSGKKDVGSYARFTQPFLRKKHENGHGTPKDNSIIRKAANADTREQAKNMAQELTKTVTNDDGIRIEKEH